MGLKISGVEIKPIPSSITTVSDRSTYQFTNDDVGVYIQYLGTTDSVFTVPANSSVEFTPSGEITIEQSNTGQITFVGAQGVTITSKADLMTEKEGSVVKLKQLSTDNWVLYGDLMDNTNMAMTIAMS